MKLRKLAYQEDAIRDLATTINTALLIVDDKQRYEICLKAPTGSGKTFMATRVIEKVISDNRKDDLCFIWISIGKGKLHEQSMAGVEKHIVKSIKCYSVDDLINENISIEPDTVVFANWEGLRFKKDGEWNNKIMRDGDYINFRDIIENTDTKIILIIDESHAAAETTRASELRNIINPDVTVELSATPKSKYNQNDFTVKRVMKEIDEQAVKDEEMIVESVELNAGLGIYEKLDENSEVAILKEAENRRAVLKQLYKIEGSNVLPLVGVMIPNAKAGDVKLGRVVSFYEQRGVTEKNGRLAIYLDNHKSKHFENVNDPDSELEVVIFKQGLDTGWDCPRAQILIQFRDIKSDTFKAQTLGRFYRMPERRYYRDGLLNKAYVFTNIGNSVMHRSIDEFSPNMIKTKTAYLKSTVSPITLPSVYKKRVDQGTVGKSIYQALEKVFCDGLNIHTKLLTEEEKIEKFMDVDLVFDVDEYAESIVKDVTINRLETGPFSGHVGDDKLTTLRLSDGDREAEFENVIWGNIRGYFKSKEKSISATKTAVYGWFEKYLGVRHGYQGNIMIQDIILHTLNVETMSDLIYKAIEAYIPRRKKEIENRVKHENYDWRLPNVIKYDNNYERVKMSRHAFDKCYLKKDRKQSEKSFEDHLENNELENVDWWVKNGDYGRQHYGIKCSDGNGGYATFYPDYVVRFTDGTIGIFDPKNGFVAKEAVHKANALQRYIKKHNTNGTKMIGGIVVDHGGRLRLNRNKSYNYDAKDMSDWEYLNDVL